MALAATFLVGCAAFVPPTPPAYTGADTAGDVPADVFVGTWRLVALNPIDGEDIPGRRITYAADGTFSAEIEPTAEMRQVTGPEPIRSSGTWTVADGRVKHETTDVEMAGDDLVSRLASGAMRGGAGISSEAEIYETGARRLVVVTDDGHANAMERL